MQPALLVALCGLVITIPLSSSAGAGPRCSPLVQDPRGDANGPTAGAQGVYVPHLLPATRAVDVITAELRTDSKALTAAIRVDDLAPTDLTATPGNYYTMVFTVEGIRLALAATTAVDGEAFSVSTTAPGANQASSAGVTGTFDTNAETVTIRVPFTTLTSVAGRRIGPPQTAWDIYVGTSRVVATAGGVSYHDPDDDARGLRSHTFGSRPCTRF